MKKITLLILLILCSFLCFAQTENKYRYLLILDQGIIIADYGTQIPDENLSDRVLSLNTKKERMEVEAGVKNIKNYFYMTDGPLFIYSDYSKDINNPDMCYIDTWDDFIAYIRGLK